jgi:hypothetical protein
MIYSNKQIEDITFDYLFKNINDKLDETEVLLNKIISNIESKQDYNSFDKDIKIILEKMSLTNVLITNFNETLENTFKEFLIEMKKR